MVSKKSIYVIDSITDEPTELVRSGSTVKLSSGLNEWILTADWSSGDFSSASKYDNVQTIKEGIEVDVSTNASGISTNASGISTNASGISTNASGISTNTSNISTNTSNISTNASNISLIKQRKVEYTSGVSLPDSTGSVSGVNYCRVVGSTYITVVQSSIDTNISTSPLSLKVQFPFGVANAFTSTLLNGAYIDSVMYNLEIVGTTPLIVEIIGYSPSEASPTIIFDFTLIGSW